MAAPPRDRKGGYLQAALMMLRPYLEAGARIEWMDADADLRQQYYGFTAGVTGYVGGSQLKLQAAYTYKLHPALADLRDDYLLISAQTTAGFY